MPCDFVEPPEGYNTEGSPILDKSEYLSWDTVKAAIEKLKHPDYEERARQERLDLATYKWLVRESLTQRSFLKEDEGVDLTPK